MVFVIFVLGHTSSIVQTRIAGAGSLFTVKISFCQKKDADIYQFLIDYYKLNNIFDIEKDGNVELDRSDENVSRCFMHRFATHFRRLAARFRLMRN